MWMITGATFLFLASATLDEFFANATLDERLVRSAEETGPGKLGPWITGSHEGWESAQGPLAIEPEIFCTGFGMPELRFEMPELLEIPGFWGVVLAAVTVVLVLKPKRKKARVPAGGGGEKGTWEKLTPTEEKLFTIFAPVSTVTYYQGTPPLDLLRLQVKKVVASNPWLAGIVCRKDGHLQLWVPEEFEVEDLFAVEECKQNLMEMTDQEKATFCAKHMINKGQAGWDDKPVFGVKVVVDSSGHFVLLPSMSHVVADGHTFYTIHNMLTPGATVVAMRYKRDLAFDKRICDFLGHKRWQLLTDNKGLLIHQIGRILLASKILKTEPLNFFVNQDYLKEKKRQHKATPETPYISTNDVITADYFNAISTTLGFMAVNCRGKGRIEEVDWKNAGNLEGALVLDPEQWNYTTIRKLVRGHRPEGWNKDRPGFLRSLTMNYAISTNWSSWGSTFDIPGCKQLLHMPSSMAIHPQHQIIIYEAQKGRMACCVFATPSELEAIKTHPMVGELL